MHTRSIKLLLGAVAFAAPLAALAPVLPAQAQTVTRPSREFVISTGRGELITLPSRVADIYIANDNVADVHLKSANQIYVFGKSAGETTMYASNAAGAVVWSATVRVGSNMDGIDRMLRLAMPEAHVVVTTLNGTVLLTGTVASPEDASEAERLTKAFVGKDVNVITRLKTATPLQVSLQVRIAEVNRSLTRNIGMNLATQDKTGGFQFSLSNGRSGFYTKDPATGAVTINGLAGATTAGFNIPKFLGLNILGALDAGENVGLVTTLAQPNLTALSGETASFLAGGEFPVVTSTISGSTVSFKKFGVSLSYTPTVLSNGRISLHVAPEVSELSASNGVTIDGNLIPGLTSRKAETTVELGSGQSFMIAGLLSNNAQQTLSKTPGAGDVPILGALFRSNSFQKGQTELVIVVTPYLVNPVDGNEIKLPTDGFQAPNMLQQLLGNMESDGRSGADRPKPVELPPTTNGAPAAPGPRIGAAELPAQAGAQVALNQPADKTKPAAAKPGFSFQ